MRTFCALYNVQISLTHSYYLLRLDNDRHKHLLRDTDHDSSDVGDRINTDMDEHFPIAVTSYTTNMYRHESLGQWVDVECKTICSYVRRKGCGVSARPVLIAADITRWSLCMCETVVSSGVIVISYNIYMLNYNLITFTFSVLFKIFRFIQHINYNCYIKQRRTPDIIFMRQIVIFTSTNIQTLSCSRYIIATFMH